MCGTNIKLGGKMLHIGLSGEKLYLVKSTKIYPVTMIRISSGPHKLQKHNFGSAKNLVSNQVSFTPSRQRKARSASPFKEEKDGK